MNEIDIPEPMLVSIRIPGLSPALAEPTNPAWLISTLAGGLLSDLLSAELSAKNLLAEPTLTSPRPYPGTFMFAVEDLRPAADVAWRVLQRHRIDRWAVIYYYDVRELIWTSIYPQARMETLTDAVLAEWDAVAKKTTEALALWREAQKGSRPPGPEGEDGGKT